MNDNQQTDRTINAKVKLHHYRFPETKHEPGSFAIVILDIIEPLDGSVIPEDTLDRDGRMTLTGHMPHLDKDTEYTVQARLVKNQKYGYQYECENLTLGYDMTKREDQEKFFSYFLTENQISSLFSACDDPVAILKAKDADTLVKIKGIGPATAARMIDKFSANIGNSRAYVALREYDLTKHAIDKLVEQFGSADVVVDVIKNNPYSLIKLARGYGWKKADAIALKKGFTRDCKERCMAYAQYCLEDYADKDGNSCMPIGALVDAVCQECRPVLMDNAKAWLKEDMIGEDGFEELYAKRMAGEKTEKTPTFFYSKTRKAVGLLYYRLLEREIVDNLKRIKSAKSDIHYDKETCEKIILKVEEEQGYAYTHEQRSAIWKALNNNISILTGAAGCVDCDTEFFDGHGWKKISQFEDGDRVLVYGDDGVTRLEYPERYIKLPCDQLWLTQTKYGVDMCTCDEHNVYYITSKGNLRHQPFSRIKELHENSVSGFSGKFVTTFKTDSEGIPLSDPEIKVMLAVIADGSFFKERTNNYCRFHIKKEKKKQDLRSVFQEAAIEWHESVSAAAGYTDFYIHAPRREKEFTPEYWYKCSPHQLQLICDNVLKWDGSTKNGRRSFSTNNKTNADFVQYAFSACGKRAVVSYNDRSGQEYMTAGKIYVRKSIDYTVSITDRKLISIGGFHRNSPNKTEILPYKTKDGFKYCFTVSSHKWIMRRNGKIMVTGNCGKSSTIKPLVRILEHYGKKAEQCALSGRAANLLTEYTGLTGKTIHRLLRYIPDKEIFACNEHNPIPADVIILDESSMVGEELFLSLLKAIRSGAKLLMLGDIKQLPPLSVGNILSDTLRSGYIPTTVLTVIQRQARSSGIITESAAVSEGHSIVKNDFIGEETRGALHDFKIACSFDSAVVHHKAVEEFKRLFITQHIPADDIQIVVPQRTRGLNSCRQFNAELQEIVNGKPSKSAVTVEVRDKDQFFHVTYKPGDRVMITRNNYHAMTTTGNETAVFNGNMGHITKIDENSMIINLEGVGKIILDRKAWDGVTHAWACTCHKLQGSQCKHAIVVVDKGSFVMLSREWLYTALTRSRKDCVLVGQPAAINTATRTSSIRIKQTWLGEDLREAFMAEREKEGADGDISN